MFAFWAVFGGAIFFASLVGNVSAVVKAFDQAQSKRRDQIGTMRRFATSRRLPSRLASQLLAYVDAEWTWTEGITAAGALGQGPSGAGLPVCMRGELLMAFHQELIQSSAVFRGLSQACIKLLVSELLPQACTKKTVLIRPGHQCNQLYFLVKGSLKLEMIDAAQRGGSPSGSPSGRATPGQRSTSSPMRASTEPSRTTISSSSSWRCNGAPAPASATA